MPASPHGRDLAAGGSGSLARLSEDLYVTAAAMRAVEQQVVASVGETLTRVRVLRQIDSGWSSISFIALHLSVTRQSVHRTLEGLIRDGLVTTTPEIGHKTALRIRLTEKGAATLAEIADRADAYDSRLGLEPELVGRLHTTLNELRWKIFPEPADD